MLLAVLGTLAFAADDLALTVKVIDADSGAPVKTADLRNPLETVRHDVNAVDGTWQGTALYLADGREVVFTPGQTVDFEVSAPDYRNVHFTYTLRKRKNVVEIAMHSMDLGQIEDPEEVVIKFGRDIPLDK